MTQRPRTRRPRSKLETKVVCNELEPRCYNDPRWNLRSVLGTLEASRYYANDKLDVYKYRSTVDRFSSSSNTILLLGISNLCVAPYIVAPYLMQELIIRGVRSSKRRGRVIRLC